MSNHRIQLKNGNLVKVGGVLMIVKVKKKFFIRHQSSPDDLIQIKKGSQKKLKRFRNDFDFVKLSGKPKRWINLSKIFTQNSKMIFRILEDQKLLKQQIQQLQ